MKFIEWLIIITFCIVATMCTALNDAYAGEYEGYAHGMVVADVLLTKKIIDDGGSEYNPIYGKHPSDKTLVLTALLQMALIRTANVVMTPEKAKGFNIGFTAARGIVVGWNYTQAF